MEMIDIELVGRYAVRPTWRNSHDTGIFTFRNLRGLAEQDAFYITPHVRTRERDSSLARQ